MPVPFETVDIVETKGGSRARSGRPTPSKGQLLRVGLMLAIAALCVASLEAGLGRRVAGAERAAAPQTSGKTVRT